MEDWAKTGVRPANMPSTQIKPTSTTGGKAMGTGLAPATLWRQRPAVPAVQEGAAVCTHPQAEKPKRMEDWAKTGVRPANMPSNPDKPTSTTGGKAMGTGWAPATLLRKDQQFLPFKKALLYARSLKLKGVKNGEDWAKTGVRPANMPSNPHRTYKHDGWQGYGHWLGTGTRCSKDKQFLPFKKALLYARSLKLKTSNEWRDWAKSGARPANMPSNPDRTYKHDGWQGYRHWLGTL